MSQNNWEADKMLDVYIFDYLMKRKLHATAKTFQAEGKVSPDPVAIDAPGGFLFEWWSVFWDIFIARTNEKHSEPAASYLETQLAKTKESQQQQHMQQPKPQQNQQMQSQQLLMQRHAQQQQQRRDVNQHPNLMANGPATSDNSRHSSPTASSLAAKMYEDKLKLPFQRDSLGEAAMKQGLNDNTGQLLDPNNASMLKAAALSGQPGQTMHGAGGSGSLLQSQNRNQQIPVSTQGIKSDVNAMMYPGPRVSRMEGPLIGSHGSNQIGNNLPLKGWPLAGVDQLGLLQQQRLLQSAQQPLNKLQLQQQLILQAQQNLASPSASEIDRRKLQMLLASQNMGVGNSSDALSNIGSSMHAGTVLPQRDIDMIAKQQQLQNMNPQQQQYSHQPLSSQQSQNSNQQVQHQEKTIKPGSTTVEGALSQGNDQTSKGQIGRKRKQPGSFSGPANSSGTANTTGPSPSSPSTPSTHTAGDAMSLPALSHDGGSSKSLLMFGSDGMGSLASAPNELADMDRMVDDRTLEENVDSFFSHDTLDPKDRVGQPMDISKGFTFSEISIIPASTSKVECCHFSSDGKLLATGGHDKKVTLWCTETFTAKSVLEEHSQWITDVRFGPNMSRLATSSADKTVRIWDVDNPGYSLRTFTGHATTVTSVDFHPSKEDLICSCDDNGEMRCWSIKNGSCTGVFKGATLTRFQPHFGRILAAAAGNSVSLLDVETQVCRLKLQGHENSVHCVTWDPSGERLASVSDDLIRVWAVRSSSKGECIHELSCAGNKFHTCVFHPMYPSLLIIGYYETIELWNMTENKRLTLQAHEKLVSSLAVSNLTGLVASASHDKCVKLWK